MAKTHGLRKHSLYKTWAEMRYRCENPKKHNYKSYGARGIYVCERWQEFSNFVADMGDRPQGTTLDRISTDGPYSPANCRWAIKEVQANNTRSNRVLTVDGMQKTMSEWSKVWKVPTGTIWRRLELGWEVSDAVKRSVRPHKQYARAEGKAY